MIDVIGQTGPRHTNGEASPVVWRAPGQTGWIRQSIAPTGIRAGPHVLGPPETSAEARALGPPERQAGAKRANGPCHTAGRRLKCGASIDFVHRHGKKQVREPSSEVRVSGQHINPETR
jgi:hypothetical protein